MSFICENALRTFYIKIKYVIQVYLILFFV
ncbi:MAG: hypothetical protein ACJAZY_001081, partial [Spirosomataceae bacterium]